MDNSKNELLFSEGAGEILFSILKKYKLEETDDEVFQKLEKEQPLFGEIITTATRNNNASIKYKRYFAC